MKLLRYIFSALCVLALTFSMCACSSSLQLPDNMVGQWQCDELASDGETDTSFYALTIDEEGGFSIYDAEAGNPGIAGTIQSITTDEENDRYVTGTMTIKFGQEDFDPPYCWDKLAATDTLNYKVTHDGILMLEYNDVVLFFQIDRDSEEDSADVTYTIQPFEPDKPFAYDGGQLNYHLTDCDENGFGTPVLDVYPEATSSANPTTVKLGDYAQYPKTSYLITSDDGDGNITTYALIQNGFNNDWIESTLVKIDGENSKVCGEAIPFAVVDELEGDFTFWEMATKVDCFGTYGGLQNFFIEDDQLVTDDEEYAFDLTNSPTLTVKKAFAAQDAEGNELPLKPGDVITPIGTDYNSIFRFITEDGNEGYFVFQKAEDNSVEYTVDGVDQYKLFETLPYAG